MRQAKNGDTVQLHYTGKLQDGTVFDTSRSRHPLQFVLGNGQVISGFEQAVIGMSVGESKTTMIPMEHAYGPRRDDLVITVNRDQLPLEVSPQIGQRLELIQEDDRTVLVTVIALSDTTLTLDANHPLSGKSLSFDLELVHILE